MDKEKIKQCIFENDDGLYLCIHRMYNFFEPFDLFNSWANIVPV